MAPVFIGDRARTVVLDTGWRHTGISQTLATTFGAVPVAEGADCDEFERLNRIDRLIRGCGLGLDHREVPARPAAAATGGAHQPVQRWRRAGRLAAPRLGVSDYALRHADADVHVRGARRALEGKVLGLTVVNPGIDQVETPEQFRAAVEEAGV